MSPQLNSPGSGNQSSNIHSPKNSQLQNSQLQSSQPQGRPKAHSQLSSSSTGRNQYMQHQLATASQQDSQRPSSNVSVSDPVIIKTANMVVKKKSKDKTTQELAGNLNVMDRPEGINFHPAMYNTKSSTSGQVKGMVVGNVNL